MNVNKIIQEELQLKINIGCVKTISNNGNRKIVLIKLKIKRKVENNETKK